MSTASRRPQLTLDELHQLKSLLGALLTLIGVGTVFYMDVDAWTLMAITAAATIAMVARPRLPGRVPSFVHTLAFPAIVAFFVVDLWLKAEVLPAMVRLDILLLIYRNITYRQRRDDLQIIVLGLFLVVVAGVLTVSLMFAVHLLVYTGCALALLLVVTLTDAAMGAAKWAPVPPGEVPAWAAHANWYQLFRRLREVADWRVLGLGCVLFLGVVAVTAVLFLAIPRFQIENSMFLDRFISKKAKSGFSESIRFGDVSEIQLDTSIALSVDVSDQSQIPATPYWRMLVLDRYEQGAFKVSQAFRNQEFLSLRQSATTIGHAQPRRGQAPVLWTFYLESGVSRYLPLLGRFSRLDFREIQNFSQAPRLALIALREEPVSMAAYRIEGFETSPLLADPDFGERLRERSGTDRNRFAGLQMRLVLDDRDQATVNGVLDQITKGEELAAGEFARRANEWLRKNHSYSLSPAIPGGDGDPLVRWLVSREAGHCELFAGSFVVLARAAGFPARLVTGFRGGSWNGYSNNFTIRNSDAHAWAEIFDTEWRNGGDPERSGAWLREDPLAVTTGPQGEEVKGEAALVSRLDRSWKARIDSLRVFWYRRIVSFDQRSQVETLKAVKEATQNSGKWLRETIAEFGKGVHAWLMAPWHLMRFFRIFATAAIAIGLVWWWRSYGRAFSLRTFRWRRGRGEHPVRREAGYWLAQLAAEPAAGGEGEGVVRELQRLRFGASGTWDDPEKTFRRARRTLRDARSTSSGQARRQQRVTRP